MSVATDAGWSAAGAVLVTGSVFAMLFLAMGITAWNGDKQTFGTVVETIENLAMVAGGFWLRGLVTPPTKDPPLVEPDPGPETPTRRDQ